MIALNSSERIRVSVEFADRLRRFTDVINESLPVEQRISGVEASKILTELMGSSGVIVLKKPKGRQKLIDIATPGIHL